MLHRLAHGTRKHHGWRVWLRRHMLPRRRRCPSLLHIESTWRNMWILSSRRMAVGNVRIHRRGKEVRRICARRLLRSVLLRLVRRGGMRGRRLLVWLVLMLAGMGGSKGRGSPKTSLREIHSRMGIRARRSQARHDGVSPSEATPVSRRFTADGESGTIRGLQRRRRRRRRSRYARRVQQPAVRDRDG